MLPKNPKKIKSSFVIIDYANLISSAKYLGKQLDLKILYNYLISFRYIHKISFYYGTDLKNHKSYTFINWLKKTGYDVTTKDVKYIKINLSEFLNGKKNQRITSQLHPNIIKRIKNNIKQLESKRILLEQPKCNFDVEIALDVFKSLNNYDSYILFSGDGDFESLLKTVRAEGKHMTVISLRKFLAGELIKNCDNYINLTSLKLIRGFLY